MKHAIVICTLIFCMLNLSYGQVWKRVDKTKLVFELDSLYDSRVISYLDVNENYIALLTKHKVDPYGKKRRSEKKINIVTCFDSSGIAFFSKKLDINFEDFLLCFYNDKIYLLKQNLYWKREKKTTSELYIYDKKWNLEKRIGLAIPRFIGRSSGIIRGGEGLQTGVYSFNVKDDILYLITKPYEDGFGFGVKQNLFFTYNLRENDSSWYALKKYRFAHIIETAEQNQIYGYGDSIVEYTFKKGVLIKTNYTEGTKQLADSLSKAGYHEEEIDNDHISLFLRERKRVELYPEIDEVKFKSISERKYLVTYELRGYINEDWYYKFRYEIVEKNKKY